MHIHTSTNPVEAISSALSVFFEANSIKVAVHPETL